MKNMERILMLFASLIILSACENLEDQLKDKNPKGPNVLIPVPSPSPTPSPSPNPSPTPAEGACKDSPLKGFWIKDASPAEYYEFRDNCTVYSSHCDYTAIYPAPEDYTRNNSRDPAWTGAYTSIIVFASLPQNMTNCSNMMNWINNTSNEWQNCNFQNVTDTHMQINCSNQGFLNYTKL